MKTEKKEGKKSRKRRNNWIPKRIEKTSDAESQYCCERVSNPHSHPTPHPTLSPTQTHTQQVRRGHNIVADGWGGASNPHLHPNVPHVHKHTQKIHKKLDFPLFDLCWWTNGWTDKASYNCVSATKNKLPGVTILSWQTTSPLQAYARTHMHTLMRTHTLTRTRAHTHTI